MQSMSREGTWIFCCWSTCHVFSCHERECCCGSTETVHIMESHQSVHWHTFLVELAPCAMFLSCHTAAVIRVDVVCCISLVPRLCGKRKMWPGYEVSVVWVHICRAIKCLCCYVCLLFPSGWMGGRLLTQSIPLFCLFVCRAWRFGWAHIRSWLVELGSHLIWDPHWPGIEATP